MSSNNIGTSNSNTASSNSLYEDSVLRAQSRSQILLSLEKKFGGGASNQSEPTAASSVEVRTEVIERKTNNNGGFVNRISNYLFSPDDLMRRREQLSETIKAKAIILENLPKTESAALRNKRKITNQLKTGISNKKMKSLNVLNPMKPGKPHDINILFDTWKSYINSVVTESSSDSQLQARLHSSELVGAFVVCVRGLSETERSKDLIGFLTHITKDSYYITVCDRFQRLHVKKALKKQTMLVIPLPSLDQKIMKFDIKTIQTQNSNFVKNCLSFEKEHSLMSELFPGIVTNLDFKNAVVVYGNLHNPFVKTM